MSAGDEDDGSGHRLGGSLSDETLTETTAEDLRRRRVGYPRGPGRGMSKGRRGIIRTNEHHEAEPPSTPTRLSLRPVPSVVPDSQNPDAAVANPDDSSQGANGQSDRTPASQADANSDEEGSSEPSDSLDSE